MLIFFAFRYDSNGRNKAGFKNCIGIIKSSASKTDNAYRFSFVCIDCDIVQLLTPIVFCAYEMNEATDLNDA